MPTKKETRKDRPQRDQVDPEHDEITYGGDMQQDDADAVHEEARKGGRPHSSEDARKGD